MNDTIRLTGAISPREKGYREGYEDGRRESNNDRWIPIEKKLPDVKEGCCELFLVSFENEPVPSIGRYEVDGDGGGTFCLGNFRESYLSLGMFVNAWMPLPEPYREED